MKRSILVLVLVSVLFSLECCNKRISQTKEQYQPLALTLTISPGFPYMNLARENPTTREGIQLGRMLFYDPVIDSGNRRTCSSCHIQKQSF